MTGVNVLLKVRRGADQAFIRTSRSRRGCVPGQRVRARVALQRLRGDRLTRTYTAAHPRLDCAAATQRLRFVGTDADQGESAFTTILLGDEEEENEGGDPGPRRSTNSPRASARPQRWDGVTLRVGRSRTQAFRDDDFRISGQAETTVRVERRAGSGPADAAEGFALAARTPDAPAQHAARRLSRCAGEAVDDAGRLRRVDQRQRRAAARRRTPRREAAIISTSVSTGVASSLTPLA